MKPDDSDSEKFYEIGNGIGVYRSGAVHLTLSWAQTERKELIEFTGKCRHLIFDLSDARFIDSVALADVRPIIQKGFKLLQLPLPIGETVEDARKLLEAGDA
ncbi:MAG: hypothetical protein NXI24_21450 [bacterium]|nr:hypothetical protein [bacterium]